LWRGNQKERDDFEDLGFDGRILLKCMLKMYYDRAWSGFIWLRIGTSGGTF